MDQKDEIDQRSDVIKIPESCTDDKREDIDDSALGTDRFTPSVTNAGQSERIIDRTESNIVIEDDDELKVNDDKNEDVDVDSENCTENKDINGVGKNVETDKQDIVDETPELQIPTSFKDTKTCYESDDEIGFGNIDTNKKLVLFFLTPSKEVVSIRNVQNGIRVYELKTKLETLTGLPAYTYYFGSSKHVLKENTPVVLGRNVSNGAVIRLHLYPGWMAIYRAVRYNDLDTICHNGGVTLFGKDIVGETEEELTDEFQKRLFTALFMAAHKNEKKLCDVLIELGADVKYRTEFDNTVLHVVACQNHMPLVDYFLKKGAELMIHNRDGKSALHIAQDIGSTSCERYMRLYNWTLTGKKHFPDVDIISEMDGRNERRKIFHQDYSRQRHHVRSPMNTRDARRCKSAPNGKGAISYPLTKSKYHSDCSRTVDFVTRNSVSEDMQNNTIDFKDDGDESNVDQSSPMDGVPRKHVPYIDLAKSEENKMVIDQRPRAKSAVVRAKHTPVYYNWYKDRQQFDSDQRYVRCKSSKSTSDMDELRRQKNEAAFRAWVRRKESEGAFDEIIEYDENRKTRHYSDEENERAFREWLEGKKELLEQMGRRTTKNPEKFKLKRERVQTVVEIGENEPGSYKTDPSVYHLAYQRWMRERQSDRLSDNCQYMSIEELKRLIEAKRKKAVLNAKAYEEWLEEKREEHALRRKLAGKSNGSSPRPTTFQKWIGMTATGEVADTYKSSKRPHSSVTQPRMHVYSMNSATIPASAHGKASRRGTSSYGDADTDYESYEDYWRDLASSEKALRAVRFRPIPR